MTDESFIFSDTKKLNVLIHLSEIFQTMGRWSRVIKDENSTIDLFRLPACLSVLSLNLKSNDMSNSLGTMSDTVFSGIGLDLSPLE